MPRTLTAPSRLAAIASTPDPVPTSMTVRSFTSSACSADRHNRVVAWWPVPNPIDGRIAAGARAEEHAPAGRGALVDRLHVEVGERGLEQVALHRLMRVGGIGRRNPGDVQRRPGADMGCHAGLRTSRRYPSRDRRGP